MSNSPEILKRENDKRARELFNTPTPPLPWSEIMGHDPAAEMARRLDEGEEQSND